MIMINDDDDDCQSRGRLPGSQNRLKIDRGTLLGGPVAAKSVQAASRDCLRGSPVRPGSESPKTPWGTRKSAQEHRRVRRSDQNRRQVVSGSEKIKFYSQGSCEKLHRCDFLSKIIGF